MEVHILSAGGESQESSRLYRQLKEAGYEVIWFRHKDVSKEELLKQQPDIMLVEHGFSEVDTLGLLRAHEGTLPFPVIAILLERSTDELIHAFAAGASDVVDGSVPFKELTIRMEHLVRLFTRMNDGQPSEIFFEDLRIETKSRKVFRSGEIIKLTPKEYDLLVYLARRANTVCHRDVILQEVWGYDFATGTNVVDVYVRHLRKKIDRGRARKIIHTVRGTGYMMH
ncbi:winged helix-turn-helix transcriptional regulator [Paenibacillus lentus]|uniref:DNA-binding response regulator n=1 Tax=Paenibacillus lentus TaxID=1338368 RepID=A0A3Q8SCD7_9BACL|nr:response regulator transcription factor [Paenibacillus lentus]AZK47389.1 DNA-binding response regulator [Paenibacillus lentus]